jgi:hypothetical protein
MTYSRMTRGVPPGASTCCTHKATVAGTDEEPGIALLDEPAGEVIWGSPRGGQRTGQIDVDDIDPELFTGTASLTSLRGSHRECNSHEQPGGHLSAGSETLVATGCSNAVPETESVCIQRGRVRPCLSTKPAATSWRRRPATSTSNASTARVSDGSSLRRFSVGEATMPTNFAPVARLQRASYPRYSPESSTWQPIRTTTADPSPHKEVYAREACQQAPWPEVESQEHSYSKGQEPWETATSVVSRSVRGRAPEALRKRVPLPKHAVARFEAWARAHWDHPYPTDAVKIQLSEQTGVSVKQVSNWFINFRKRSWHGRRPEHQYTGLR